MFKIIKSNITLPNLLTKKKKKRTKVQSVDIYVQLLVIINTLFYIIITYLTLSYVILSLYLSDRTIFIAMVV